MTEIKKKTLIAVKKKEIHDRKHRKIQNQGLNKFAECVDKWHKLSNSELQFWERKATMRGVKGFNLFMSKCQLGNLEPDLVNLSLEDKQKVFSMEDIIKAIEKEYRIREDESSISEYNNDLLIRLRKLKNG